MRESVVLGLRAQLTDELGLTSAETDCVSDVVMTDWDDVEALADDPEAMVDQILLRVTAAEAACFTAERQKTLEASLPGPSGADPGAEAHDEAFLTAVVNVDGVAGPPAALLQAGEEVCARVAAAGSLMSLLGSLTPGSKMSEALGDQLAPAVGSTLSTASLSEFSIITVVGLCPEYDDS